MPQKKKHARAEPASKKPPSKSVPLTGEAIPSALATVGGPSTAQIDPAAATTRPQKNAVRQKAGAQVMAQAQPFNALKAGEHGYDNAHAPRAGTAVASPNPLATASTQTESSASAKTGGAAAAGVNATIDTLDRVRVDSAGQALTTNMGTAISDNQNSLKAGLRGPTLLEDFVLREKLTHFDHERIPERIVHARGSGAHGYFECYKPLGKLTKAAPFAAAGKITPVFVRFSTVAGERGSTDLARDVRGFAVKFYTDEGNWDIVGNNIPVFFIQDAMKFPDLIHAVKPEPHNGIPQAASAHDTFWDFASLMPESTHMLLWVMSDRALPRSYRTMQGFGVHTFRLVNEAGKSVFCKFHWNPVAGTHSVVWDEAVKISGADADYHRRDLWEAIEAGSFPEWELCLQTFTEEQAEQFSFDVLDATKIVPEELVPLVPVGRMVLNRNPDNFFAETEQVAFGTANVVPGIDFSNDPLLHGRHHSYLDTQLSRLGGPNFHELPINASIAPVHNNQRDGIHRQAIPRGRVAYEPNSLGGGCPFQAGMRGFTTFPAPVFEDKLRGKPEKFADHYTQATLFWNSQTQVEKNHIIAAFRFELTRVQVQAIRERVLGLLANVADELAQGVAAGLGIPVPPAQPRALANAAKPEVEVSKMLSLFARPGDGSATGKKIALLVCDGVDGVSLRAVHQALIEAGAAPRFVGARLGIVKPESGQPIHVEITTETAPSVLWDAVVIPGGEAAQASLSALGQVKEFLKDQYRHCKPILALGASRQLIEAAGLPTVLADGSPDLGIIQDAMSAKGKRRSAGVDAFIAALAKHRYFDRDMDPPLV
ncbi:catalase [Hydrocarboniphaga sp.]|uniref:catalase n=1 Tax=Hydrocarboniphaga sp. TaxID=2033016 RepID=UPI003D117EB1